MVFSRYFIDNTHEHAKGEDEENKSEYNIGLSVLFAKILLLFVY